MPCLLNVLETQSTCDASPALIGDGWLKIQVLMRLHLKKSLVIDKGGQRKCASESPVRRQTATDNGVRGADRTKEGVCHSEAHYGLQTPVGCHQPPSYSGSRAQWHWPEQQIGAADAH